MFKLILASLTGAPSDTAVLETSVQVATRFSAHVDCLHVSAMFDADALAMSQWVVSAEQIRAMEKHISEVDSLARSSFEEVCERKHLVRSAEPGNAPSFAYIETVGHDLKETIHSSRVHDLTIIARDSRNVIATEPDRAGKLMLSTGRPILVPPRKAAKTLGSHVVVAWKNAPEAARALGFAMPLLAGAEAVTVLAVSEGEDDPDKTVAPAQELARALRWYGIKAETKALAFSLKPVGETVLDEAYRRDADLLVMGGYGHSRLREFAFGGMTREILSECEIPVFLSH